VVDDLAITAYREAIEHYCKLGDRVIDQSRRRVLEGEQVPNAGKIYSIFEPHTDLIKRGKCESAPAASTTNPCPVPGPAEGGVTPPSGHCPSQVSRIAACRLRSNYRDASRALGSLSSLP
jgi:hypothetical protein